MNWHIKSLTPRKVAKPLLGLLVFLSPGLAEDDHAPLPEQCIADYHLWQGSPRADVEKLPVNIIQLRQGEMWECASVVKSSDSSGLAYAPQMLMLSGVYSGHLTHRTLSFIDRHGLMTQFVQEDAAGQGR